MAKLTAAAVRRVLVPGRYGDGDTLYLNVTPTGTKSWIQRIVIDGRRHDIGLGAYPLISLAHARERAIENRLAVANGHNPLAEKRRTRTPTFRNAAEATFQANLPRWRDGKTAKNWMQGMEKLWIDAYRWVSPALPQSSALARPSPFWSAEVPDVRSYSTVAIRTEPDWLIAQI